MNDSIRKELFLIAKDASYLAYAPYSKFNVGAAILTSEDEIVYTGCNIENASFGATICAERVAVSKAISEGKRTFKAIAIYSDSAIAWPCGICRQFIHEFAPDIEVIVGKEEDQLIVKKLKDIFLEGFKF